MDKTGVKNKEWQVIELGEIAKIETGSKNTQDKVDDGKYPFYVRSQEIEHIDTYSYDCEAIITAGDGVGVGKVYHYVKGKFDCHQRAYVITDFKNVTGKFLYYYLLNFFYRRVKRMSAKNSVDSVRMEMLSKMKINLPPLPEQQKIAEILSTQDKLIELQEKKIEQLKELKKAYLQKMFPQKGSKYPELRFKGFTTPWEQRKLGDDLESIQAGTNLLGSITNHGTPLLKMGNIQRGYFDISKLEFLNENETVEKENIAYYGDFFFNTRNTLELVGKGATWTGENGKYAFNSNIARFTFKDIDTIFFNYLYNTEEITTQIHARATGTTSVAAIYPKSLNTVSYYIPSKEEQIKIGNFFFQLDSLITLHQRKSEQEKQKKKALMQLLLTGIVRTK